MKKKLLLLAMAFILLFTTMPAIAAERPVIYKDTITVTADGGRYQVGFVNVEFKKNFLDPSMLPTTFDVQVYAENGTAYIEFAPSTPLFFKSVHIRTDAYNGLLYDIAAKKNINVDIKHSQVLAQHFSRLIIDR